MTQPSRLSPLLHQVLDLVDLQRPWLIKRVPSPADLQLHIARAHGIRVQRRAALSSRVRDLAYEEGAVGLGGSNELLVLLDAVVVVVTEDGVPVRFDGVVGDHLVAANYNADVAFAPALVQAD